MPTKDFFNPTCGIGLLDFEMCLCGMVKTFLAAVAVLLPINAFLFICFG